MAIPNLTHMQQTFFNPSLTVWVHMITYHKSEAIDWTNNKIFKMWNVFKNYNKLLEQENSPTGY